MPLASSMAYGVPITAIPLSVPQLDDCVAAAITTPLLSADDWIASVVGLPSDWANMATWSAISLKNWTCCCGLYWSSRWVRLTFQPLRPPLSFNALKYATCPLVSGLPMTATGPLSGVSTPRLIVLLATSMPGPPLTCPALAVVEVLPLPPEPQAARRPSSPAAPTARSLV